MSVISSDHHFAATECGKYSINSTGGSVRLFLHEESKVDTEFCLTKVSKDKNLIVIVAPQGGLVCKNHLVFFGASKKEMKIRFNGSSWESC